MNRELQVELGRDCVVVRPGYNGDRHRDSWARHDLPFGIVVWAYEDGEIINVQIPANGRALETFAFKGWLPSSFEHVADEPKGKVTA